MSIVERAADKLRQTNPETASEASVAAPEQHRVRDHIAAAGQRELTTPTAGQRAPQSSHKQSGQRLAIDFDKLQRAGLVPARSEQDKVAREYQRIKRPLLAQQVGGLQPADAVNANRFMVGSAIPGEGKTFTSFNLALSLAKERDSCVVLVDGDVIQPSVSRALGINNKQGLTDILADDSVSFGDVVLDTNVPRLSILPAGQHHEEATELLASQRMTWLMNELGRDPKRMIVFDSPPLLATAEAQSLAMAVGRILLVVKAGSTDRAAVEAALSLVAAPDKSVSLILNQSRRAHGDYYAGYYGGYYDGHHTGV